MRSRSTFGSKWKIGDTVCCSVDVDQRTIRFTLNGDATDRRWGVAFENVAFTGGLTPAFTAQPPAKFYVNFGASEKGLKFAPPPGYEPIATFVASMQQRVNPNASVALTDGTGDDLMPKLNPAFAKGVSMALVRTPGTAAGGSTGAATGAGAAGGLSAALPAEVQVRVTSGYAHALVSTEVCGGGGGGGGGVGGQAARSRPLRAPQNPSTHLTLTPRLPLRLNQPRPDSRALPPPSTEAQLVSGGRLPASHHRRPLLQSVCRGSGGGKGVDHRRPRPTGADHRRCSRQPFPITTVASEANSPPH